MALDDKKLRQEMAKQMRTTLAGALSAEEFAQLTITNDGSINGPPEIVAKATEILTGKPLNP